MMSGRALSGQHSLFTLQRAECELIELSQSALIWYHYDLCVVGGMIHCVPWGEGGNRMRTV